MRSGAKILHESRATLQKIATGRDYRVIEHLAWAPWLKDVIDVIDMVSNRRIFIHAIIAEVNDIQSDEIDCLLRDEIFHQTLCISRALFIALVLRCSPEDATVGIRVFVWIVSDEYRWHPDNLVNRDHARKFAIAIIWMRFACFLFFGRDRISCGCRRSFGWITRVRARPIKSARVLKLIALDDKRESSAVVEEIRAFANSAYGRIVNLAIMDWMNADCVERIMHARFLHFVVCSGSHALTEFAYCTQSGLTTNRCDNIATSA